MTDILKCDLCGADAGNDPYHITFMGDGHVHVCSDCFDPQQHDVGVLREKLNAAIKDAERWRLTFVNLQNSLDSALKSSLKLLDQIQVLEMRLAVCSQIISDRSHAGGAVMSQWIKCSDRLPDPGEIVLVCKTGGRLNSLCFMRTKTGRMGIAGMYFWRGSDTKRIFVIFSIGCRCPRHRRTSHDLPLLFCIRQQRKAG